MQEYNLFQILSRSSRLILIVDRRQNYIFDNLLQNYNLLEQYNILSHSINTKDDTPTCQQPVTAKPFTKGDPGGKWIVSDFYSHHSCRDCDLKRKRNYVTKTITEDSKTVNNFIPSKKRVGSTKQLMAMTKESVGITLKVSHARNIVHSKSQNSVCVYLGQYLLLQTYFDFLREKDEEGTFVFFFNIVVRYYVNFRLVIFVQFFM